MSAAAHRWGVVERLPERFDGRRMIRGERIVTRHKTEQAAKAWCKGFARYVRRLTPAERQP